MKNFIGRNIELEVLERTASEAESGGASSIFLSGKRGVGKTKLLRHLYSRLFNGQNNTVPFYYAIKTAFASVENFSRDYLTSFVLQSLAFRKKDPSMIDSSIFTLEELRESAVSSGAHWASDIIDGYLKIEADSDTRNMFLYAITAPNRSHQGTGIPVVVMLDDFHKIKKFCEMNADEINADFWLLYEHTIRSLYTPHIFTGLEAEMNEMFFEETSFGDQLEIMLLSGLERGDASDLFQHLCDAYGLSVAAEASLLADVFAGNPFYMKTVLQAARRKGRALNDEFFWALYFEEVTRGKTFKYWTSLLKKYVPALELRKPSLRYLYHLCNTKTDIYIENPEELLLMDRDQLERIMKMLNISGTIESGFSVMKLAEDRFMSDVIQVLYHSEVLGDGRDRIKEVILGERKRAAVSSGPESFDVKIPAAKGAELVAIKSLEEIAMHYKVPLDATAQLQLAIVELIANAFSQNGAEGDSYQLKFIVRDGAFVVETTVAQPEFTLSEEDERHIRAYLDDIHVEEALEGTKIVLTKSLSR